jgi:SSS family solute:Na+ symporter
VNIYDYAVLLAIILGIAIYGILRTRGRRNLHDYLRGKKHSWLAIGLSVMATQASAVTFLSTPGQGYQSGMAFVQNYFAVPLAMVIIAAFFLPIFRRLNVYTAYEYLGTRFDKKTRLLAAGIFLVQRALNAGYTVYAPAIVLSTVFGWSLSLTIVASSVVCIVYTVVGGSDAVTHTQKYQFAIIMGGMIVAFCILMSKIPCSFTDALTLAGHFGKTNAVSFSVDPKQRYTVWTGMLGGIFLMLSYYGTDQSQVQRYISGDDLRESRLGLMFNALMKIPMQFFILLLGVMLFVFYQFHPTPVFFNQTALSRHLQSDAPVAWIGSLDSPSSSGAPVLPERQHLQNTLSRYERADDLKATAIHEWTSARERGDAKAETLALQELTSANEIAQFDRKDIKDILHRTEPALSTNDSDYVFITFILNNLPHGLIGLLVACFFGATLNAKAGELNALTTCTVIDFYRYLIRPPARAGENGGSDDANQPHAANSVVSHAPIENQKSKIENPQDRHYVRASKLITIAWGIIAMIFALFLFTYFQENLIQATNIVGSLFSGVILGLFLIAFFIKFIHGTAAFWGAILAESLVIAWFITSHFVPALDIAYLLYNLIGSLGCILFATLLQLLLGPPKPAQGFPVITQSATTPT